VRGLSLVELMVGVAIGLFIVGGALTLFANNVVGSRLMLAETRLNQDLRAATDLITRDLRRAGYWGNAIQGTTTVGATGMTTANPYSAVTSSAGSVDYNFSTDTTENNALDSTEQFGVRLTDGALQLRTSSSVWTDITDKRAMTVTTFSITPTATTLGLGQFCAKACGVGSAGCPTMTVRSFVVNITGQSVRDSNLRRSFRSTVRLRNDALNGACPA
jgi:type IV pilus assembly protein PilW